MIGLVDYDWFYPSSKDMLIPNLEIMKLATYYKIEERTFCRLLSLDETELDGYKTIFFFSELATEHKIPPAFLRAKNVIYGGTSFTKGKYIPFENSVIDFTIAKPSIYKEFLKQKYQEGTLTKIISHVLDDSYYRIHAGDNLLPTPPVIAGKRVIIYDRDFFITGWKEKIQEIEARRPSTIVPIHPVFCHKLSDYFSLREEKLFSRRAIIILDLNLPLDEADYMMKRYKTKFMADILLTTPVCLPLGGNFPTSTQYYKDFVYKINLLYKFWSVGIPMKLRYFPPDMVHTNPLDNLERLVTIWSNNAYKSELPINERIHHKNSKEVKEATQQEKDLLLSYLPSARDLFDQTYTNLKNGGYWRI